MENTEDMVNMENIQNMQNKSIHIVYASSDNFCEVMGTSIISLFENSKDVADIQLYILDSEIRAENKEHIEEICDNYGRKRPEWILARDISKELGMKVNLDRGSLSQYARLFVSSVLPENLDKVLYLDCDILIEQSIRKLWEIDLQGKTIAALMDAFSKYYRMNINLEPNDIMFNSGVMLIDLKKWKEHEIEQKLMKFIASKNGKIQQGDQGALNAVLSKETFCFEPKFNSVTIFYDFNYEDMMTYRRPPRFYTKQQVQEAVDHPVLIHFTTSFLSRRPWVEGCEHKYVGEWLKYKAMSPWAAEGLWKDNSSSKKRLGMYGYKILPPKIALFVVSLLQVYGRPLKNYMKELGRKNK